MTEPTPIPPTRGERNNNPGNIEFMPSQPFHGQIGLELVPLGDTYKPRFGRYDTPENGLRAIAKLLLNYQRFHGLHTVAALVSRWSATDQQAYIADVARYLGVEPNQPLDLQHPDTLEAFVYAIVTQENGRCLYDAVQIARAAASANANERTDR